MSVFLSVASPFPQVFFAVFFYSCWLKVTQFTASSYLPLLKEKVPFFFGRSVGWLSSSSSYFSRPFLPLLSFFFFCCLCCKSSQRYQDKLLSLSFFFSGHYHFHPRNFIFPFKVEKRNKGEEGGGSSSSSFRTRINHLTLVPLES